MTIVVEKKASVGRFNIHFGFDMLMISYRFHTKKSEKMGSLSELSQNTLKIQDPFKHCYYMLNRCAETKAIIFAMLCLMYAKGLLK